MTTHIFDLFHLLSGEVEASIAITPEDVRLASLYWPSRAEIATVIDLFRQRRDQALEALGYEPDALVVRYYEVTL
jgi:hypothetical protein